MNQMLGIGHLALNLVRSSNKQIIVGQVFFPNSQFQRRSTTLACDIEKQKFPVQLMLTDIKKDYLAKLNPALEVRKLTLRQLKVMETQYAK